MPPRIECPGCGSYLDLERPRCSACGFETPKDPDGIVRLLEDPDGFYEGRYTNHLTLGGDLLRSPYGRLKLRLAYFGYLQAVVKRVPRGASVLEIGSGSGSKLLGDRYRTVAMDLSAASLRGAPESYHLRLQADVFRHDFEPASFDAVVASFFFEHLTAEQKRRFLAKAHRWLAPGGLVVLLFDTESQSPVFRRLRSSAAEWREWFIEHDGHLGLESVEENARYFSAHGFEEELRIGGNRLFQRPAVYEWTRNFKTRPVLAGLADLLARLTRRPRLQRLYGLGLELFDRSLGRLLPESWSTVLLGCWRRRDAAPEVAAGAR